MRTLSIRSHVNQRRPTARLFGCRHNGEQRFYIEIALKWEPERQAASDVVPVSTSLPFAIEVSSADEIRHNSLRCPLSDVQQGCKVTNADSWITSDQQKRVAVIRQ